MQIRFETLPPIPTASMPVHLAINNETQVLYCSMPQLDQVGVFEIKNQKWLAPIKLPSYPGYMKLLPKIELLITANYNDESLSFINLINGIQYCLPAGRYPRYFATSTDTLMVATVNFHVGTTSLIDLGATPPKEHSVVKVGPRPVSVAFFYNSKTAVIIDQQDDHIYLFDSLRPRHVWRKSIGASGRSVVTSPHYEEAYVSAPRLGRIIAIDGSGELMASIQTDDAPVFHGFLSDGERLFVVNGRSSTVAFIDVRKKIVVKTIPVAPLPITAFHIAEENLLMVIGRGNNTITLLDTTDYTVAGSLALGKSAYWIAYDQKSRTAYVSNEGEPSISAVRFEIIP